MRLGSRERSRWLKMAKAMEVEMMMMMMVVEVVEVVVVSWWCW